MSFTDIVDLCSDDEHADVYVKAVKSEPGFAYDAMRQKEYQKTNFAPHVKSKIQSPKQESEDRGSGTLTATHSSISMLEQGPPLFDDTDLSSSSSLCPAPLCRKFWNAGNYEDRLGSKITPQSGKNYLHVHPMFLHSNATSHKWAFGAVAELLDNAVDEIQNGATFVIVDKISNPRDGSTALLIHDDGGGMDPEAMRRCMSFGFSDKKSKSAIGQYGNGFKTSSMRLGADVVVFSRHLEKGILTQSIGLLSYTFLSRTGNDRIVVPMVDYQFNKSNATLEKLIRYGSENFISNMSILLQWSPFSSETELLNQFNDIGSHGTKIIIYNLWFNEDGNMELDFDTDLEDIRIGGETRKIDTISAWKSVNEQHIANRYHYSLRVYSSFLYLQIPEGFKIILRGKVVDHHNIANDLKFPEVILYKPHSGGSSEGSIITTIGFLKEAPHVNFHGFNVYHKNRLVLPFWQVVNYSDSRGRGVVGVLEANFIEPTHNKQDFERTSLFQKLEQRLKEMTWEYWDYHCGLIGYQIKKQPRVPLAPQVSSDSGLHDRTEPPIRLNRRSVASGDRKRTPVGGAFLLPEYNSQSILNTHVRYASDRDMKRKGNINLPELDNAKKQAVDNTIVVADSQCGGNGGNHMQDQESRNLLLENEKLKDKCSEHRKMEEELILKATKLRNHIRNVKLEYAKLLTEMRALDPLKEERDVNM